MKFLTFCLMLAVATLNCRAATRQLTLTGTITAVSGTYMSTRAHVGDTFTVTTSFDSSLAPFGNFNGDYQYAFNDAFSFTVNSTTFSGTSFTGTSLDNQVEADQNSTHVDGYQILASTTATADTSALGFQVQFLTTNLNLVSSPPVSWLATTDVSVFDYAHTIDISGTDNINPSPQNLIHIAGTISTISITGPGGAIRDFNGDGTSDIAWQNLTTGDRALWLINNGTYASGVSLGNVPAAWRIAGTGDINGDGKADIIWENTSTGDHYIWLMNGTAYASGMSLPNVPPPWRIAAVADMNGDGNADLIWENPATGQHAIWLMNASGYAASVAMATVPTEWRVAGAADFNGDGKADIIWEDTSTGQHAIWIMNGTTYSSAVDLGTIPVAWRVVATGDYNGDGKADIVWENSSTGQHVIWLMNGTTYSGSVDLGTVATSWGVAD